MLLDAARQRNLLPDLRARRRRQLDLREIGLDVQDTSTSGRRADVDEEELVLHELGHLGLFFVLRLDAEQAPE